MALGRMSSLARLLACPGYQLVVQDDRAFSEKSEEARKWGIAVHSSKEGLPVAWTSQPEDWDENREWLDRLHGLYRGWEHEVHVSYDLSGHFAFVHTNEETKRQWAEQRETVLTGCVDAWLLDSDSNRIFVNDLKTGEEPVDLDEPQLMGYLLTGLTWGLQQKLLTKAPFGPTCNLSVLHYPRTGWWRKKYLEEDGKPWRWNARDVELDELRAFRTALTEMLPKVKTGLLQAGDHCVFCPGHSACPLWVAGQGA